MAFGPIQPLGANLLQQIANPPMADVPGAVFTGQRQNQTLRAGEQAIAASQQDMATQKQGTDAKLVQESFYDAVAAFQMSGAKRQSFLETIRQKVASHPGLTQGVNEMIEAPPEEQDAMLLEMIQMGTERGVYPIEEFEERVGGQALITLPNGKVVARDIPGIDPEYIAAEMEKMKRSGQTINIEGTIPAGFRKNPETGSLEMIPGGPPDIARLDRIEQVSRNSLSARTKTRSVLSLLGEAEINADAWTTGVPGAIVGLVPGTRSFNLQETLDAIKANLSFDKLQEMRDMSPTGGALGQVSERELAQLERTVGSLNQKQDQKQLLKNLQRVRVHYNNWLNNTLEANIDTAVRLGAKREDFDIDLGEVNPLVIISGHPEHGDITEEDIQQTMAGPPTMTREQVLQQLGVQ